jgi:hypothetical protein
LVASTKYVYRTPALRPVFVIDVPLVVCVVVTGVVVTVYVTGMSLGEADHESPMLVFCGVGAVRPRTAAGRVIDADEITAPPWPLELTDVTVNVYVVPGARPVFVNALPDVVCVVERGVVVIWYDVAPTAAVHVRSAVVICGLLGVRFVTANGKVKKLTDDAVPPFPLAFTD